MLKIFIIVLNLNFPYDIYERKDQQILFGTKIILVQ